MAILVFSRLTDANPYALGGTPDFLTGWTQLPLSNPPRILSGGFRRSSGTGLAMWVDNANYTGNTLVAKFTHAENATLAGNDSARVAFSNSGQDGYCLWLNQAGTEARIYTVTNCVMDATPLATFTSYGTGYSQQFELRCVDKSTGTFQFWRNGVQVGANLVDTTYTGLEKIGPAVGGGALRDITTGALFTVSTLTSPIVSGQPFSGTSVGAVDGAGTISTGGQTVPITFAGGGTTFSGTWPALTDGIVYPLMNGSTLTFTVAQGGSSSTINSVFNPPEDYDAVEFGAQIDEPDYLLAGVPIESGFYAYYETPQTEVGDIEIYPDGSVYTDAGGVFTMYLHRIGDDNVVAEYNINAPAGGVNPPQSGTKLSGKNITATKISASKLIGSKFR